MVRDYGGRDRVPFLTREYTHTPPRNTYRTPALVGRLNWKIELWCGIRPGETLRW